MNEQDNPLIEIQTGSIDDNKNLSPAAVKALKDQYANTRFGDAELYGKMPVNNPNSLFPEQLLAKIKLKQQEFDDLIQRNIIRIIKTVIAVDAAVSTNKSSDETGIIAACLCSDNKVYILEDASGKLTPDQWASKAVELYERYHAAKIIMEANQGGNLLVQAIKTVNRYVRTELIHATVNKQTRFEPVVMAYERKEVWHVGDLSSLEKQMQSYDPYAPNQKSPDRADAAAWCVYALLLGQPPPAYRSARNFGSW